MSHANDMKEAASSGPQQLIPIFALFLLITAAPAYADEEVDSSVDFFGDFRLRLEQDWDSLHGDGSERDDRLRLRVRLRGGIKFRFADNWSALVQARSGPNLSQQSPHITIHDFDGGSDGPYEFNLDQLRCKGRAAVPSDVWCDRTATPQCFQ